jgi:hypothetical protein
MAIVAPGSDATCKEVEHGEWREVYDSSWRLPIWRRTAGFQNGGSEVDSTLICRLSPPRSKLRCAAT